MPTEASYTLEGMVLENMDSIKYLGVTITHDLRCNTHISNMFTKANRTLGFLRRNLYQCPQDVKEAAYRGLVHPILECGSCVWDPQGMVPRVASGPRVKLASYKSALTPHPTPVIYSTYRSKAVVYSTRRFVLCLTLCYFVLLFFSPFSIGITSLGEERANLSAFRTFVRFALVWFCLFPLPLGVCEGLSFVVVALPGLFSYRFFFLNKKSKKFRIGLLRL